MKSNVCKIEKGTRDLDAILGESARVAAYNGLSHKQSLQLRLLCEEIDGMLPKLIDDFDGDFWIDFENGVCKVNVSLHFNEFTAEKKAGLVGISKNKKNAATVGVVGKIRSALENMFLDQNSLGGNEIMLEASCYSMDYYNNVDYYSGMDYTCLWSLEQYRSTVKQEEKAEAWDELEKSVIASVADDVIVGVKGKRADIVVVKKFI